MRNEVTQAISKHQPISTLGMVICRYCDMPGHVYNRCVKKSQDEKKERERVRREQEMKK